MSWQAYKYIWKNSKQTGGLKLTLLALADFANEGNGWKCWPSIETLADMVGVTDRQMKRNLIQLEEAGEIVIERKVGRGNVNIYDISPMVKGDMDATFYEAEKVTSEAEKVTSMTVKGDIHVTQTNRNQKETKDRNENATDPLIELADFFIQESKCRKPYKGYDRERWLQPLVDLYGLAGNDFEKTKLLITESIKQLREKKLTIANPGSLHNTAVGIATPSPNSNGHNGIVQPPAIKPATAEELAEFNRMAQNTEAFYGR